MRRNIWIFLLIGLIITLAACGDKKNDADNDSDTDELVALEVDLTVTEAVEVDENVDMKAVVTYGDEDVADADEVVFEVWEEGKKDDSQMIKSTNHEDGTYTATTKFDHDGTFHIQVHVTARDMHTMPKATVTVGDGGNYTEEREHGDGDHEHGDGDHAHGHSGHFHTEGFGMHFMEPKDVNVNEAIDLVTHIQMEDAPLEKLHVRYEIWNDDVSDAHDWVDASESTAGEYAASHTFTEAGTYHVQIHVQDDADLHEHAEYEIEVGE